MASVNACKLTENGERNRDLRSAPPAFLLYAPVILWSLLAVIACWIKHFSHGSRKQQTHCLMSSLSHILTSTVSQRFHTLQFSVSVRSRTPTTTFGLPHKKNQQLGRSILLRLAISQHGTRVNPSDFNRSFA